ncbi:cytochrome P450 ClCP1 [Cadophora sp. MPI-SDFR-AT-0126]|nr:cytochrome P450 ClCP1 [Leotiomycetes sp. MPI-SDFR-AT-0126]
MTNFDFSAILVLVGIATLTYILSTALYNLYLHPLSSFPGPLLNRAFHAPFLQRMLIGRLPHTVKDLHEIYGPIVRISPTELSFTDPSAWKAIYQNKAFIRPSQWRGKPPGVQADSLISASVEDHARFRKVLLPAFSEKAVDLYEPTVEKYVDVLVSKLGKEVENGGGETVVDVVRWINFATFDIISELGWGESFHCLEKQDYHPWITVILQFQALMIAAALSYYPVLEKLVSYITPKSALAGLNLVLTTSEANVKSRLRRKPDRPDIMSYILQHNELSPETGMSEAEMIMNSMALIVAGSETLTAALAGTINNLLSHPKEMERLAREVRSTFTSESEISGRTTKDLPYLKAVLQEGMRLCPPIPDNMHREVPQGGAVIGGHMIPEGVTVGISCFSMFRSNDNFAFPDEFVPERWLRSSGDKYSRYTEDRHDAYHPFSVGVHGCLGQHLAWLELRVIMARLLWNFDLGLSRGTRPIEWTSQKIFWAWEKDPMSINIKNGRT